MSEAEVLEIAEKYKKVASSGGTYVVEVFYNLITGEEKQVATRDYDYNDGSRDIDILYNMPIDEEARVIWLHRHGIILKGDTVVISRGRKLPKGAVKTIADIKPYKDRYGRTLCDYAYFTDGTKTNIDNCDLIT